MSRRSRSDYDAHAGLSAARNTAPRPVRKPRATLPASRVLGWMVWVVVAAAAYRYLPQLAAIVREFI